MFPTRTGSVCRYAPCLSMLHKTRIEWLNQLNHVKSVKLNSLYLMDKASIKSEESPIFHHFSWVKNPSFSLVKSPWDPPKSTSETTTRHSSETLALAATFVTSTPHLLRIVGNRWQMLAARPVSKTPGVCLKMLCTPKPK